MARGSDASASAAVPASDRLRRMERSTNENLKNIPLTLLQSAAASGFLGQLLGWQQEAAQNPGFFDLAIHRLDDGLALGVDR